MQRVTYVNVYGESVVFSGEPPVLLRSVSGFSRPEAQILRTQGAYQAGEMFQRLQLPARSIQVQFDLPPCESREAMYRERMRMERVLAANRCMKEGETGLLIYENDAGSWQVHAVPEGTITYGKRFGHALADCRVRFLCPDAYLQERAQQSAQMRMGAGSFTLPFELPMLLGSRRFGATLVNGGTADAPLAITIYGTGETPTVVNHTTGAKIVVSRTVSAGERLAISTDPMKLTCVLYKADGTTEDAFGYLDPSIAVSAFVLVPGENEIEYVPSVASNDSRLELIWRNVFEGV